MNGIYNTRFIYYNSNGEVQTIKPFPPEDPAQLYFEIDFSLVEEFLFGNKSFFNYKINYFLNLANGNVSEEEHIVEEQKNFLYIVPLTSSFNNEITIEHNSSYWNLLIREDVKFNLKLFSNIDFFICKKDDPSFYYFKISFDLNNLTPVYFTTDLEKDITKISLVTIKQFNSYGIKTYE